MRTVLLLATAATCAWWASPADAQQTRTERRVVVIQPQHAGSADSDVYVSRDDRALNERDYRGRGRWVEGEWTPDRRRFEGVYEVDEHERQQGRSRHSSERRDSDYERHGANYDGPPPGYEHGRWNDDDMVRRCRSDNGLGGAAIGGVVGGAIGNRVAGRGNRTVGTVVGAVTGAAAGAIVDRSEDARACETWSRDYSARTRHGGTTYGGGYYQGGDYASDNGGYAYGGMQTIVIPGQPVIIEETETFYEEVLVPQPRPRVRQRVAPRRVVHRPRPRPRCVCR